MDEIKKLRTEQEFKDYYEKQYISVIDTYYQELRKENIKKLLKNLAYLLIALILFFGITNLFNLNERFQYFNLITVLFVIMAIYFTISSIKDDKNILLLNLQQRVVKDILAFILQDNPDNILYEPKLMISKDSFEKAELFNLDLKDVKFSGENYVRFKYNNNTIVFSDLDIYLRLKKNEDKMFRKKRKTIFNGVYVGATFNKKNTSQVYLIPNNFKDTFIQSKIMHYIKFKGYNVQLENLEFSKKYKVYSNDEVQARYILSLSFMEKINELDKIFPDKKYIVFKQGRRFCICIENNNMKKANSKLFKFSRHKRREYKNLSKVYQYIYNLIDIYNILDLGNDLYVKHLDKKVEKKVQNKSNTSNVKKKVTIKKEPKKKLSKEEFLDNQ